MRALRVGLASVSMMAVGCLFPSFDGFDGPTGDVKLPPPPSPPRPISSDAGPSSATDAGDEGTAARASTIACRGQRCGLGTEVCCGGFTSIECKPAADALCATGFLRCADNENCVGGQKCCFNSASTGAELTSCRTDCDGDNKFIACDPSIDPPHCPAGMRCKGRWRTGLPFCE